MHARRLIPIVPILLLGCAAEKPTKPTPSPTLPAATAADAPIVKSTRPAINRRCPVMPEHRIDPNEVYIYRGTAIGFCCEDCAAGFKAMNTAERDEILNAARKLTE